MPKLLTDARVAQYERDGIFFPVRVMPAPKADLDADALAAHEDAMSRVVAALYQGTGRTEMRR